MEEPKLYLSLSESREPYPNGGSEAYWMDRLAAAMELYLKENHISFERTGKESAKGDLPEEERKLCLYLQSQTAPPQLEGKLKGPQVCYLPGSKEGKRAAEMISEGLQKVYPQPELVVLKEKAFYEEAAEVRAPVVKVQLAYHDNPQDEVWFTGNLDLIAKSLSWALCRYFGAAFRDA